MDIRKTASPLAKEIAIAAVSALPQQEYSRATATALREAALLLTGYADHFDPPTP